VAKSPWKVGEQGKKTKALRALVGMSSYCCGVLRRQPLSNTRSLESSAATHSRSSLLLPVHSSIKLLVVLLQVTTWPTPGKLLL